MQKNIESNSMTYKAVNEACGVHRLTSQQESVLRERGTEPPNSSKLNSEKRSGTYSCIGCGSTLFVSGTKYESGSGWPSFYAPVSGAVESMVDISNGLVRTEVVCSVCKGHLGHVFPDGPPPTGDRYCINGIVLEFLPDEG